MLVGRSSGCLRGGLPDDPEPAAAAPPEPELPPVRGCAATPCAKSMSSSERPMDLMDSSSAWEKCGQRRASEEWDSREVGFDRTNEPMRIREGP